jgi:hypothetical protein
MFAGMAVIHPIGTLGKLDLRRESKNHQRIDCQGVAAAMLRWSAMRRGESDQG